MRYAESRAASPRAPIEPPPDGIGLVARVMNPAPQLCLELLEGIEAVGSALAAEWQDFVLAQPSVHLEQLWAWGEVRRLDGWEPVLLTVRRDGSLVAGCLLLHRPLNRWVRVGYVSRGPLIATAQDGDPSELNRQVIGALKTSARKLSLQCLVVDLPYFIADGFVQALRRAGFSPHLPQLPPASLSNGALLIDLSGPEEQQLQAMRRSLRRNVRQAREGGVVVREGGEGDIELLWRLLNDLCRRRGVRSNVSSMEVIRRLWQLLEPAGQARIDVAEVDGRPVVALLTVLLGAWAIPWRIGWSGEAARLHPEKYLYWSVLHTLRAQGCQVFDFNWVDLAEADAVRNGSPLAENAHAGMTFFKMGFGGELIRLPGAFDYFSNPWIRWGMLRGGRRLLGTPWVQSLIRRLAARSRSGSVAPVAVNS